MWTQAFFTADCIVKVAWCFSCSVWFFCYPSSGSSSGARNQWGQSKTLRLPEMDSGNDGLYGEAIDPEIVGADDRSIRSLRSSGLRFSFCPPLDSCNNNYRRIRGSQRDLRPPRADSYPEIQKM